MRVFFVSLTGIIIQTFVCIPSTNCAKILIFHLLATYSHRLTTWPLAEELSLRGHNITYLSPYYPKQPNPNITEFVPERMAEYVDSFLNSEFDVNIRVQKRMGMIKDFAYKFAVNACERLYTSPDFLHWLSLNTRFDLVLVDSCWAECGIGLAYKLNAKYAIFSPIGTNPYEYDAFGYLPESSAVPELESVQPNVPMNFFERVANALMSLRYWRQHSAYYSKIDYYIRNTLQMPDMPYIGELVKNVALVFYTGDVITDYPKALPPIYVNVAGIHCKESTKNLPEDLEKFINSSTTETQDQHGFLYISLGSMVVSSNLPEYIKQSFFQAIKAFPELKFLWKWNGDFPKDIPENLFLSKWFPQMDVLAHPKIRAFITQGGRPSATEAVFNGVPMIVFPVNGDQDYNANRLAQSQAAVRLEIGTVTVDDLKAAIRKTVYEPKAKARMTKFQNIFRDRPMSPLDTAVWWTEYILRTEDTAHLKPAGNYQNWFVRRQIDVWAFLSVGLFLMISSFIILTIKTINFFLKTNGKLKNE